MKKQFIWVALLAFLPLWSSAAKEKTVTTKVRKATVFLNGAQVFRSGYISIDKGITQLVVDDVSSNLNPKSVQASAKGKFLILDVKHGIRYNEPKPEPPRVIPERIQKEILSLEDSLVFKRFELERINGRISSLTQERKIILDNKLIKGQGRSDTMPVLKEVVSFYREKITEIDDMLYDLKFKQYRVNAREKKMQTRLSELRNYNRNVGQPVQQRKAINQILVTVMADAPVSGRLEVNYLVSNALWYPAYDLRSDDTDKPMKITYKAFVKQQTGEDWKDVKITLSTFNQNCSTTKPSLAVWYMDFQQTRKQQSVVGSVDNLSLNLTQNTALPTANSGYVSTFSNGNSNLNQVATWDGGSFQPMVTTTESFSNVEFKVDLPYTIKSDGKESLIVMQQKETEAEYYHYILPKVNKDAFLLAKINDWESLSLLNAKANLYFDQTYVGETTIDPYIMSDTMELALGRDKAIFCSRKKIKDEVKDNTFSKNKVRTITFEVVVRNNKKSPINLLVEDQIPITKNEEIKINLTEKTGAKVDKDKGSLTWDLDLKPGESKKLVFSYTISHDKNKKVT